MVGFQRLLLLEGIVVLHGFQQRAYSLRRGFDRQEVDFGSGSVLRTPLHLHGNYDPSNTPTSTPPPKTSLSTPFSQKCSLYPPHTSPQSTGTLPVDSLHTLYYEEYGQGSLPALFLHGGPGAGCTPNHARFFNPTLYRIILLDQRGCGKSTPKGCTQNNTLQHLVQDCEVLRESLGIEKWVVVLGGSWGSTLALAYAQEYPQRVANMVLRGVCMLRPKEVDWLFSAQGGAAQANPQGWEKFTALQNLLEEEPSDHPDPSSIVPQDNGRSMMHLYYDALLGNHADVRLMAARLWFQWEMTSMSHQETRKSKLHQTLSQLHGVKLKNGGPAFLHWDGLHWQIQYQKMCHGPRVEVEDVIPALCVLPPCKDEKVEDSFSIKMRPVREWKWRTPSSSNAPSSSSRIPAQAMLTCFYSANTPLPHVNLLHPQRIHRLRQYQVKCIAVQGGCDGICPPDTALDLHRAWPEMELRIPLFSGHSMYEPDVTSELVKATNRIGDMARG